MDEISLQGARGVLINITGGDNLTLFELDEAANRIREEVDPDANIIVGSTMDSSLAEVMRVSVVATGIDANHVEFRNTDDTENKTEVKKINTINQEPKGTDNVEPYLFKDLEKPMESEKNDQENDDVLRPISEQSVETAQLSQQSLKKEDSQIEVANTSNFESTPNQNEDGLAPLEETKSERKRFGINSLISRMTNNNEDYLNKSEDSEKTNSIKDSDFDDEDRVEIPAFLRRQAN